MRTCLQFVALAGSALAAGCTKEPAPQPPIAVPVGFEGGRCVALIDGRRVSEAELQMAARAWRGREVSIRNAPDTPYKCIGAVIFGLQRAGVKSVGFISEPPPAGVDPGALFNWSDNTTNGRE